MIFIIFEQPAPKDLEAVLLKAVQATLRHENAPEDADVTITLADDRRLQSLNHDYLGIDAPTDVLSFPAGEYDPQTGNQHLGDVIISLPRADKQAETAGHPLEAELELLAVHGVLHLMGYDHAEEEQKIDMWAVQREILTEINTRLSRFPD